MQIDVLERVGVIDTPNSSPAVQTRIATGMTSDEVAAVFRRRMTTLVRESQARRASRHAASGVSV